MDTMRAYEMAKANLGRPRMVFDWIKAAQLIAQHRDQGASAGLEGDWGYTGGQIWRGGNPGSLVLDDYTYLASTWATPQLQIGGEFFDCFIMETETEWTENTKWPPEATTILFPEHASAE